LANVLVVDDKFDDLDAMKKLLEKNGHQVVTATNGAAAFDALKTGKFDAVLIDILLPIFSGYDLLKLMRARVNGGTKIVYVSVVSKKDVVMDGADGFIQKPFSSESFMKEFKKILVAK
jgi:CheY-like chemotaxis protein